MASKIAPTNNTKVASTVYLGCLNKVSGKSRYRRDLLNCKPVERVVRANKLENVVIIKKKIKTMPVAAMVPNSIKARKLVKDKP